MECVIFTGIQASGKSTFYKERYVDTHLRLNMDMLRTRYREKLLLDALLEAKQPFVVDNTNPLPEDRHLYIEAAKSHRFTVVGFYFAPDYEESVRRNNLRTGKSFVREIGIRSVLKNLVPPAYGEGFDELYTVTSENGLFTVERTADTPAAPGEAEY
ncbi:ATP-binding protein [Saccharibacillus sp. CPCC 101409]|uniref:AAA family ATPase n=1 Tax=Saccharibacillus sp. CPCC 101409 TaxID=3058041 RepID=UPI002673D9CE|nr:AAA family ATPase [Saccharibacillus sp. CPCC 101409]MDO3410288.1 ATP-binding protein [Saccharibacillus sp. CPCC 101409]